MSEDDEVAVLGCSGGVDDFVVHDVSGELGTVGADGGVAVHDEDPVRIDLGKKLKG